MACSSPTTLVCLAVFYGIITATTFASLYLVYQQKITELSEQCSNFKIIHKPETETEIQVIETRLGDGATINTPIEVKPKHSSPDVRYSECICPRDLNSENQDDRLSRDSFLAGTREPSLLSCCSINDTTLQEKIIRWTEPIDYGSEQGSPVKAVMVVGSRDFQIDFPRQIVIQSWSTRNEEELGYVEGIQLEDGHLVVPRDGYYLVHSKVVFHSENQEVSLRIDHSTSVASEDRPGDQSLMRSERLHCSDSAGTRFSSFHSGIFKLFRDDKVYVTVSSANINIMVTFDSDSSLFGMYLLGTE